MKRLNQLNPMNHLNHLNHLTMASIVLAAALVPACLAGAQDNGGRGDPPPTRPGGGTDGNGRGAGGGAGGQGAGDGARERRGSGAGNPGAPDRGDAAGRGAPGRGAGPREAMRGDAVETTAWLKAIDDLTRSLSEQQRAQIELVRTEWKVEQERWASINGEKMKQLQKKLSDARKDGGKPDAVLMDDMRKIVESRPKFEPYRRRIAAVFTPEQAAAHKAAFDAQRKSMAPMDGAPSRDRGGKGGPGMGGGDGAPPSRTQPPQGPGGTGGGNGGSPGDKPPVPPTNPPKGH